MEPPHKTPRIKHPEASPKKKYTHTQRVGGGGADWSWLLPQQWQAPSLIIEYQGPSQLLGATPSPTSLRLGMAAALEKCRFSPFLTSSARGSKSPKREVSYGQEALLTLSSGVLSRPSISSMPSPQPPTPHLPTPTVRNFPIFQGPTLHQPSSSTHLRQAPLSFTSPDSSHPQGVLQTLPPQRLPKQNHWPATQSGSSSPPRFLPTFSWGRLEGAEIGFSPPRRTPTAQQWQGAHSPTRGRSRSGVIPESQWGRLRRRGRGCRKRQLQLPGCQARSLPPPPAHRLPIGPRVWPRPMGEPREAPPPRAHAARRTPAPQASGMLLSVAPQTCVSVRIQATAPTAPSTLVQTSAHHAAGTPLGARRRSEEPLLKGAWR